MLRNYQTKIVRNVYRSWIQGHKRPCVVAPCGAGKTVIAAELARQVTIIGERVLFVVHRKEICDQTQKTFQKFGVDMNFCIVGMVQTLKNRKIPPPDLIIVDEDHHVYATSYTTILERFPDTRVVGLTATPIRMNEGGLGKIHDDLIIGPSVSELIERKHLAPFRYFSHVTVDTANLQVRRGEFIASEVNRLMDQEYIYGNAVDDYIKYGLSKTIVYCSSVKNSQATADAFQAAGISAVHVDGKTPNVQRGNIMADFRAGRVKVLCNVDIVSEGFDVKDCNSVILLRPTMSLTLHIQQSMRCMRKDNKNPDKIAVILDMVENFKRHGLPDTPREWSLNYVQVKDFDIFVCDICSTVYNGNTFICKPCGGWDMRTVKCRECKVWQQRGFGYCNFCGCEFSSGERPRREREQMDADLQEIKSFVFEGQSNYEIIDKLREVQKVKGHDLNWTYDVYKMLGT